mgnify:CR=1 FL=1
MPSSVLSWIQSIHKKGANKIEKENLMPYIPIPYPQQQQGIPMPQVSAPQAPTVNLTGVMAGVGAVADASRQRMIPVEPFLAPGQGMQQIGRAIMPLAQLAAHYAEAKDDVAAATAQSQLAVEFEKFRATMPKTDPDTWERSFDEFAGQALERVMANENLSPGARQRIKLYGDKWQFNAKANIMRDATVEMGQRAESALFANVANARRTGNFDAADAMLDTVEADVREGRKAYVDPRNIESERARNAAARETAAKEAENAAELSAIQADPDAYLAENGNPRPGESPQQFSWRTNLAQEMSSDKFHTQQAEIADALSQPGVTPDQLDSILQGQRPSVAAKWRAAYDEMQDAKIQAFRATPEYINPTWAKADEMIQRFDRNAPDWREQVTEIRKLVMTLPVGWRQYLPDLDSKIAAKPPEPAAALQNEIGDSIDNMFKQGGFGPVEQDITLGKPFDSDTYEKVKPGVSYEKTKPGKEPLPEAQLAGPRSAKTALKLRMLALMKAHPEWNNDPQKAWDELNNSGKRVHRGSAPAVNFGPSAPVPPEPDPIPQAQPAAILQDGVPYDMPNNPQAPGPSSLLLPTGQQSMWVADAKNGTTEVTPMTADDVKNWQDAGEKTVKVWDISGNKWVNIPPGELKPGRHAKPSSLFPPP